MRRRSVQVGGQIAVLSFSTLHSLACRGAGVAYVPDFLATSALRSGELLRCFPDLHSSPAPVYLVYRVGADRIQRVRLVLDLALELLPPLLGKHVITIA